MWCGGDGDVDVDVVVQLTAANQYTHNARCTTQKKTQIKAWEARLQQLGHGHNGTGPPQGTDPPHSGLSTNPPTTEGVLADATNQAPPTTAAGGPAGAVKGDVCMGERDPSAGGGPPLLDVVDYAPDWDTPAGGAKLLLTVREGEGGGRIRRKPLYVQFGETEVCCVLFGGGGDDLGGGGVLQGVVALVWLLFTAHTHHTTGTSHHFVPRCIALFCTTPPTRHGVPMSDIWGWETAQSAAGI